MTLDRVTPGWLRARGSTEIIQRFIREATPTARLLKVAPELYHLDPCKVPSLSAGIAHTLVAQSPAHAYAKHPRLGGSLRGEPGTERMNEGTIIHRLMLGKGKDYVPIVANDYRTNAAKQARDDIVADGKVPILQHRLAELLAVAEKARERAAALGFALIDGEAELAVEWTDEDDGVPVLCRSMFDYAWLERAAILDVKKVESAHPQKVARNFVEYGWDIQYAAYCRAVARLRPEFAGRIDLTFLLVEVEPPYSVVPAKPDGYLREIGAHRWNQAVRLWRLCLETGEWPDYSNGVGAVTLEAPPWLIAREFPGEMRE